MDYLDSNEIVLHHRSKETVSLSDIFITPDLRTLDDETEKFDRIISSLKIKSPSSCPKKCIIVGEEQSGKTSLAKDIFKSFLDKGKYPILLKGSDLKSTNIEDAISSAKLSQYNSPPKNIDLIIVEEIEQAKFNSKFLSALVEELVSREETTIFLSGNEIRYNESLWKEVSEISKFELLPFGHVLRGELINKWNSLGQELTIDLCDLHAANDRVTHHIDSLLRKNIVPPKPIFILMILQTLESNSPSDFSLTAYGHCYNALIQQSLKKAKIKNEDIDKYINYLTELAYFIYLNKKNELSDDELNEFKASYSDKYLIESHEKVIQDMCQSGLLKSSYSGLSFSYKYIYYFYAAKHIAENHELEGGAKLTELCQKIHSEKHANILIFVTYHTKDQKILDEILAITEKIFPEETPASLNPSDTEHFEEVIKTIPALVMENKTAKEIEESRKSKLDKRDKLETIHEDDENGEEEELVEADTFADINRSAKAVEIIGQILRNRYGSLRKDQLTDLTQSAFNSGLKFLSFYFRITKSQKKEIIEEITRLIKNNSSLTDTEVKDEARKLFLRLCYGVSFSVIKKISFSVGSDHLIPIFKKIAEESDTPASHLINLCIQLEFTKQINKESILLAKKKINPGTMAYRLLQEVVIQHLYLHNVSFDERQWISSKLSIPVREQRYLQGQKKTKILS